MVGVKGDDGLDHRSLIDLKPRLKTPDVSSSILI